LKGVNTIETAGTNDSLLIEKIQERTIETGIQGEEL
jgi:hypothetical protein